MAKATALVIEKYPDTTFQVNWLPYFLNPDTPLKGEPYRASLEAKFGGAAKVNKLLDTVLEAGRDASVEFDFERIVTRPNTLRAHRLVYRAQSIGHRPAEVAALVERLFVGHFQRGEDIGDIATLAEIAAECGDRKDNVVDFLTGNEATAQVKSLVGKVAGLGVNGVPFYIVGRRLSVSGAQSEEVLAAAIMQTMS